MRPLILFCAVLMILWASCKKSDSHGSPNTKDMIGNRSFYRIDSGYNYSTKTYWGDTSEVTVSITYENDATVWFGTKSFSYDATSADGTVKYRGNIGSNSTSHLSFDPTNNVIRVRESYHVSTGLIDETTDYISH